MLFYVVITVLASYTVCVNAAGAALEKFTYKITQAYFNQDGQLEINGFGYNEATFDRNKQNEQEWNKIELRLVGNKETIITGSTVIGGYESYGDGKGLRGFEVNFALNRQSGLKAGEDFHLEIRHKDVARGSNQGWQTASIPDSAYKGNAITFDSAVDNNVTITMGKPLIVKVMKKPTSSGSGSSGGSGSGGGSGGGSGVGGGSGGGSTGGSAESPTINPPDGCDADSKKITFYYSFLGGWVADGGGWKEKGAHNNDAKSSSFPDKKILQDVLGVSSNEGLLFNDQPYPIKNKNQIIWFYNNYYKAIKSGVNYSQEGDKYFITYDSWCTQDGKCYDANTGCPKSGGGECTYKRATNVSQDAFVNAVFAMDTSKGDGVTTTLRNTSDKFGKDLRVVRYFTGEAKSMANPSQNAIATVVNEGYKPQYIHPAVHIVTVCKGKEDEPKCEDEVNQAICDAGDAGTEAIFHEDNRLKTCTLKAGNQSGFTILEKEDTTNPAGKSYCEAACKDDIDIFLPGHKQTAAGQYFLLDKYIPEIKAKRTCVSSEIKYDEFIKDLEPLEEDLVKKYNEWQDLKYIEENAEKNPEVTETKDDCCHKEPKECPKDNPTCEQKCLESTKKEWTRPAVTSTPNRLKTLEEKSGEWIEGHDAKGSDERASSWQSDVVQPRQEAENAYKEALKTYSDTINAYTKCFEWIEENVPNTKVSGTKISKGSASDIKEFKFEPDVTFNYNDKDSDKIGSPFEPELVEKKESSPSKSFWPKGATVSEEYSGGGGGATKENRGYLDCKGTTCRKTDLASGFYFYSNSHMKREENVEYKYHLPKIYTTVPDGKVHTSENSSSKAVLELPEEAVPVNINTLGGLYDYIISINNVMDSTREEMKSKSVNSNDNFEERFAGNGPSGLVLTEGNDYICDYEVINDIYIPNPGKGGKLNFFYRIVDPLEINPLGRQLGYNWSDARGNEVRETIKIPESDHQILESRDKFEFTLTPYIMKELREYNAKQATKSGGAYADWDLSCKDYDDSGGYHCRSQLLSCLAAGGETSVNEGMGDSCSSIFKDSLSGYRRIESYDLSALNKNRQTLINKQNALDNKGGS